MTKNYNLQLLIESRKKAIVFLGYYNEIDDRTEPIATGFLIRKEGLFILVTAKHVVFNSSKNEFIDQNLLMFASGKNNDTIIIPISHFKNLFDTDWFFHPDENIDIAIIPISFDEEIMNIRVIPPKYRLTIDQIHELFEVFYLSYQPGIEYEDWVDPILRTGTISRINKDKTFLIDGFSFPGNSGSPVFTKPEFSIQREDIIILDSDTGTTKGFGFNLIGVIGGYVYHKEEAVSTQTLRKRVTFEENIGLSLVWSTDYLIEIIENEEFSILFYDIKHS